MRTQGLAKVRVDDVTPKWMSYRRQVVQNARRSRLSRSRSQVSSFIRSNDRAVRQRPGVFRSVITPFCRKNARGLRIHPEKGRTPSLSRVASWKLPPCDAGLDDARVSSDVLNCIPAIMDHDEAVSR